MQRISFNINARRVPDERQLFKTLERIHPTTVGVMDGLELAQEIKARLPYALVWHRDFEDSEAWKSVDPVELAEKYHDEHYGAVYAYNINEPYVDGEHSWEFILEWLIRLMAATRERGVRCVVGNLGAGNFERYHIFSLALFDPYLRALAAHDGWHVGGWHDYTGPLLPLGMLYGGRRWTDMLKPDRVQPATWTRRDEIDPMGPNWHLMRWTWMDARCRQKGIKLHRKVISEFGFDRMPDLENSFWHPRNIYTELTQLYGVPAPHRVLRGMNTLRHVFAGLFPYWSFERALFEQYRWADHIYDDTTLGFNLFQWCPGAPDWDIEFGFDVSRLDELHSYLASYRDNPFYLDPTL
jgi:hypothetical protein